MLGNGVGDVLGLALGLVDGLALGLADGDALGPVEGDALGLVDGLALGLVHVLALGLALGGGEWLHGVRRQRSDWLSAIEHTPLSGAGLVCDRSAAAASSGAPAPP